VCETIKVVRRRTHVAQIAQNRFFGVSVNAESESSRIKMRGLAHHGARIAVRCFCLPLKVMPRSPTTVLIVRNLSRRPPNPRPRGFFDGNCRLPFVSSISLAYIFV
jgi:hypothetical protein